MGGYDFSDALLHLFSLRTGQEEHGEHFVYLGVVLSAHQTLL
jgi:hypothetical protein